MFQELLIWEKGKDQILSEAINSNTSVNIAVVFFLKTTLKFPLKWKGVFSASPNSFGK